MKYFLEILGLITILFKKYIEKEQWYAITNTKRKNKNRNRNKFRNTKSNRKLLHKVIKQSNNKTNNLIKLYKLKDN